MLQRGLIIAKTGGVDVILLVMHARKVIFFLFGVWPIMGTKCVHLFLDEFWFSVNSAVQV